MSSEKIRRERELFEQYKKQRAPGVNLQRIGAEYVELDVQWHFETWLARANMPQPAAPVVQAEPVAVAITEKQVMTAYFSAGRLHISGTTNWVAAFAQSLNKQIAAPPAIPAQPDASVLSILRDARESVHYHKGMQNLGHEAGKRHAAELATLIGRIGAALAGKGGE